MKTISNILLWSRAMLMLLVWFLTEDQNAYLAYLRAIARFKYGRPLSDKHGNVGMTRECFAGTTGRYVIKFPRTVFWGLHNRSEARQYRENPDQTCYARCRLVDIKGILIVIMERIQYTDVIMQRVQYMNGCKHTTSDLAGINRHGNLVLYDYTTAGWAGNFVDRWD